jgi:glutamate--cysteine ligase
MLISLPEIEPLHSLGKHFHDKCQQIETWFEAQWRDIQPPVYGSVDLRNAGFKLAPIDMNLFPAGFNNLNPNYLSLSITAAKIILNRVYPGAKRILIIPESHTRNQYYWENMKTLQSILEGAGYEVKIGAIEKLTRHDDELRAEEFIPEIVLLNNDLSEGIPDILQNIKQVLVPPAELGWSQRLKSGHFQYYAEVTAEFADVIGIDPWLVAPLFRHCGEIDFMQQEGLECLIGNAEVLFEAIKKKYEQYQIKHQPFLIVKADAGTYGMAVMTVRNVDELRHLNRKQRTRMSTIKGGQPVRRVIIQEGVYSFETVGSEKFVAEPVVYLWGSAVVGGFYRVHQDRGVDESLNTPGMKFEPLPFERSCADPCENQYYLYGVVARLSMLAAAREIKDQKKS